MKNLLGIVTTCSVCLTIVLVVVQVIISNKVGMLGKQLTGLEGNIEAEKFTNEFLTAEVASASSMFALEDRAKQLGFHEPSKNDILIMDAKIPVAYGGITP